MAKYSNTKAKINEKITTNGAQAVTGIILNDVLQTMVDSLGADYQFGGLVQPGSSFTAGEQTVVFLATTPGTYTNFGGLVVADGEVALLVWSGSAWSKQTPDIATRTEVGQLGQEVNKNFVSSVFCLSNIVDITDGSSIKSMSGGYYDNNGVFYPSDVFVYQKVAINHSKAYKIQTTATQHAISSLVLLDSNEDVIFFNGAALAVDGVFIFPVGIEYFAVSSRYSETVSIYEGDMQFTSKRLADNCIITDKIAESAVTEKKCSFFNSVNIYNYLDPGVVRGAFIYDGELNTNANYFTSPYISVKGNTQYLIKAFASGINYCKWICYFDESFNFLPPTKVRQEGEYVFITPNNAKYLRFSADDGHYNSFVVSEDTTISSYIDYKLILNDDVIPEQKKIIPDVVFARNNYILNDIQNSIYFKNIMSFYDPSRYAMDKYGGRWDFRGRCMRTNGTTGNISVRMIDVADLSVLLQKDATTRLGSSDTDDGAKVVNVIGDSFTYNGKWFDAINSLCPNLSFVGMRKSYNAPNPLRAEGRGGWTMSFYANLAYDERTPYGGFSPFIHPSGYKYYGVTGFWKAIANNEESLDSYQLNGFDDYKSWFSTTDGKKLNPNQNDMMYDSENEVFIYYNGSDWATFSGTPQFEFDYGKYIDVWNISSPDFVLIMLGVNDFFDGYTDQKGNTFITQMQGLVSSIQSYAQSNNKTIVIGICTNNTIASLPNANYGQNPVVSSRSLFLGRKKVLDSFDTSVYESQGVYIIDTAAVFDPDYGFNVTYDKPFSLYEGDEREMYDVNGVHPSDAGYAQLGTCAAGFIQYIRGL